jgi:hypothetical protein
MQVTREQLLSKLQEIDSGDYAQSHYERFVESYYFIEPSLKSGMRCLDLGSYGHFRKLGYGTDMRGDVMMFLSIKKATD